VTTAYIGDNEQEMEYYGVLTEVLELRYMANDHGDRSVFFFAVIGLTLQAGLRR
jgi:hypothetical protein